MFVFDVTKLVELAICIIVLLVLEIAYLIYLINAWLDNRRWQKKTQKNREIAIEIIETFEELLDSKDIKIPSKEREGNEDEACIYGTEYYELENSIIKIIERKMNYGKIRLCRSSKTH